MSDTTTTAINLDEVRAHLDDSKTTGNQLESNYLNPLKTDEAMVIGHSDGAPPAVADELATLVELWREHDARLETIYGILIKTGSGSVSLDTQTLRDEVGNVNGVDSRGVTDDGLDYVVGGGSGNDTIVVDQNADGTVDVTVNGVTLTITEEEAHDLRIDGGDGNDEITVNAYGRGTLMTPGGSVPTGAETIGFRINGGDDDDVITGGTGADTIDAGEGRDYVDAGRGDDRVDGGDGFDTIYGGDGQDRLYGQGGDDYIDGGEGADIVSGLAGDDVVAGGNGNDTVYGGTGDDVLIAGRGDDNIRDTHEGDNDTVYAEAGDDVDVDSGATVERRDVYTPTNVEIDPNASEEFRARAQADLDTLGAIPAGAGVLRGIDGNSGGHTITIGESPDGSNQARRSGTDIWEGGPGDSGTIEYAPTDTQLSTSETFFTAPPVVWLHHELLHGEDYVNGELDPGRSVQYERDASGAIVTDPVTGDPVPQTDARGNDRVANNRELSVVGLPFDEDDTDRTNTATPSEASELDPNNRQHTENALREQLGLEPRTRY